MVALMLSTAQAANRFGDLYHAVQVKDETGRNVTDITNLFIYLPGTTTDATIYSDKNRQNTITIPMTEASTNTTLIDGLFTWWGPDKYDFSMTNTDGVGPMTNSGHADRDSGGGTLVFPTYLVSITTASFLDAETITMGTGADWVFQGGNVTNQLSFTPAADDSTVNFGVSGTGLNTNFNVFTGTSLGFKLSSSGATHSLTYDGGIVNLNPSSNFAVNICTGTSTGATAIGNSAGGAVSIDTDTSYTINADDASTIKVSAGTLLIEVTGGDLTIDSPDKSILIDSGESVTDAVIITASGGAGGVELVSGTGDITLDSGDDIFLAADTGTGDVISIINTQGTDPGALIVRTVAAGGDVNIEAILGRIEIEAEEDVAEAVLIVADGGTSSTVKVHADTGTGDESILLSSDLGGITVNAAAGSVDIEAVGATDGDIILNSGDDMTFTVAGDLTLAVTGATNLGNNQLRRAVIAISDTEMDNLAGTQIELVASPGASAYLEFVSAVIALDWGSVAWTEPSAPDDLAIRYTDGSGAIVSELLDATGFATATADSITVLAPTADITAGTTGAVTVVATASVNKALVLDNTGSEWTNSGDSQVVVIIYYRIHTTAELGL